MHLPLMGIISRAAAAGVSYLLRATFTAGDQTFSDAQVLDTTAEGVEDGSLTVKDTSTGSLEILSNKLKIVGATWNTTGYVSNSITRAIGITLLADINITTLGTGHLLGWANSSTLAYLNADHSLNTRSSHLGFRSGASEWEIAPVLVVATDYQVALMLGGYDVNGIPYKNGDTKANFTYGVAIFIKGGIYSNWTLIWKHSARNTATTYVQSTRTAPTSIEDNIRVPDVDLSALLEPVAMDTFTDTNGTSLDAHTMDVGSGWTEQNGDWDIQGNYANATGGAPAAPKFIATTPSSDSDVYVESIVNIPATNGGCAIILRYTDNANLWMIGINDGTSKLELYERNGGGFTLRASTAFAVTPGVDYTLTVIAEGQTITGFVDGTAKTTYASAALNETTTTHGIRADDTGDKHKQFAVYPRGTGGEYSDLSSY